jgi:hypothetical protein
MIYLYVYLGSILAMYLGLLFNKLIPNDLYLFNDNKILFGISFIPMLGSIAMLFVWIRLIISLIAYIFEIIDDKFSKWLKLW